MRTSLLALFLAGIVGIPASVFSQTINACVKNNGKLRIVSSASDCKSNETPTSWNQQGPKGDKGESGPASEPKKRQLVGFSTESLDGIAGLLALSRACHADFPGSRICMPQEIVDTSPLPAGLSGVAWIDAGPEALGSETCDRWLTIKAGKTGRVVILDDKPTTFSSQFPLYTGFHGEFCSVATPVACCAPAE